MGTTDHARARTVWTTFFVLIAIVFNPLIPIYLKKQAWMYIDGAVAAVILGASGREGGSRRTVVAAGPAARKLARSDDARRWPSYCGTKRNCRSSHISVGSFVRIRPAPQAGAMVCREALRQQRRPWTVGSPSNSKEAGRRLCWRGDLEAWPARQRARLADRHRSSCGFMPTRELCRMILDVTRRSGPFAIHRADFVPVPFGIVWPSTAHPGSRAGGRLLESGLACRAGTA